jgi:hypothetical protein
MSTVTVQEAMTSIKLHFLLHFVLRRIWETWTELLLRAVWLV